MCPGNSDVAFRLGLAAVSGKSSRSGEHRLNTVKRRPEVQNENWLNSIARKRPTRTLCSLSSIESHFGKLEIMKIEELTKSAATAGYQLKSDYSDNFLT